METPKDNNSRTWSYLIVAIAIVAGAVAGKYHSVCQFRQRITRAKMTATKCNLEYVANVLEKYRVRYGHYPSRLEGMADKLEDFGSRTDVHHYPGMWMDHFRDPQGAVIYKPEFDDNGEVIRYVLCSCGPDNKPGTLDDIMYGPTRN